MREIINRIRYVLRDGIAGEALPKDRPPWYLGDASFRKLGGTGRLDQIQHELLRKERAQSGRAPSPTVAILDSQTVKGEAPQGERGSDGAKKRVGRKRHVAVDPGGRLLASVVTTADGPDQEAGLGLAAWLVRLCPWIERVIGDEGDKKRFCDGVRGRLGRTVEVVERPPDAKGFVVRPQRGKVEQTLGVRGQNRRLPTDFQSLRISNL